MYMYANVDQYYWYDDYVNVQGTTCVGGWTCVCVCVCVCVCMYMYVDVANFMHKVIVI